MALLTIHHWPGQEQGLGELLRVARKQAVILTYDFHSPGFWLMQNYFPEFLQTQRDSMPSMDTLRQIGGAVKVTALPVPNDCSDGFLGAYWRRPHACLDPGIRTAISNFSKAHNLHSGLARLRQDLDDGGCHAGTVNWCARHDRITGLTITASPFLIPH